MACNQKISSSRSHISSATVQYSEQYRSKSIFRHHHHQQQQYQTVGKRFQFQNKHLSNVLNRNCTFRRYSRKTKKEQITKHRNSSYLWEEHKSSTGRTYYYNVITDRSQWEKPSREQLSYKISSSTTNKSFERNHAHSKRSSNNDDFPYVNNQYHQKKSNRSMSKLNSVSNNCFHSTHTKFIAIDDKSHIFKQKNATNNENESINNENYRKQKKDYIDIKSSVKKLRKDKMNSDKAFSSTPASPPPNEIVKIDQVDPFPLLNNSFTNISIQYNNNLHQQTHNQILSNPLIQNIFKLLDRKKLKYHQSHQKNSSFITCSSVGLSSSTINAILELEHSKTDISLNQKQTLLHLPSTTMSPKFEDETQYYSTGQTQNNLLKSSSIKIQREPVCLLNEHIKVTTWRLISLRTDLFSFKLRLGRNRFHLIKYHHILANHQLLINKFQLID